MVVVTDLQVSKSVLATGEEFTVSVVVFDDHNAKKYCHKSPYRYAVEGGGRYKAAKGYPHRYPLDYTD